MNVKTQIHQLWSYLKVQDDELLIVRSFNNTKNADEYIVAKMVGGEIEITTTATMPDPNQCAPFQLIQQRGENGKRNIPSVEQLKLDELLDY